MSNIFTLTSKHNEKPKRNPYDISFGNDATFNMGTLYPVFCKEVYSGDSISIDTNFQLRAQPLVYPIQTRVRADIHYFYVRTRTLWDNFMDFFGRTKDGIVHPYIDRPIKDFKTGSIYDFLGIPTTIMEGSYFWDTVAVNPYDPFHTAVSPISSLQVASSNQLSMSNSFSKFFDYINRAQFPYTSNMWVSNGITTTTVLGADISPINTERTPRIGQITGFFPLLSSDVYSSSEFVPKLVFPNSKGLEQFKDVKMYCSAYFFVPGVEQMSNDIINGNYISDVTAHHGVMRDIENDFELADTFNLVWKDGSNELKPYLRYAEDYVYLDLGEDFKKTFEQSDIINSLRNFQANTGHQVYYCLLIHVGADSTALATALSRVDDKGTLLKYNHPDFVGFGNICRFMNYADRIIDTSTLDSLPWCGPDKVLRIDATPYRAYEAIYNSWYRNTQNDPFIINGVKEYNKYVTNRGDGADSFPYQLYQRNWELDYFTSAVQSPQQGEAPLVGITTRGNSATLHFHSAELADVGVTNGNVTASVTLSDDGTITGISGYDSELPQSTIQRLMSEINQGISINDFRQTNAFQRWLEKNIRRGYRYKDQVSSHFGVNISYNDLLMPEFIGGISRDVNVNPISQTTANESGALGQLAGQAAVIGKGGHRVSKYCDETGFIIGILSIVPIPVYSQTPASYAFRSQMLDYYYPEFGNIGMQPIYNYELTPLQSNDLFGVFGYQRPYGRLISSLDEAHGEFRTTANGYLLMRQFADAPVLNGNFLKINNEHLNDVFAITDENISNQFLGSIWFHVKKKTSIPLFGEPKLEPQN